MGHGQHKNKKEHRKCMEQKTKRQFPLKQVKKLIKKQNKV